MNRWILWLPILSFAVLGGALGYRAFKRHRPLERRESVSSAWLSEHRDT